jgi:hypothetical protein
MLNAYEPVKLSSLPIGGQFTRKAGACRVYQLAGFDKSRNLYLCDDTLDNSEVWLAGDAIVFSGFNLSEDL